MKGHKLVLNLIIVTVFGGCGWFVSVFWLSSRSNRLLFQLFLSPLSKRKFALPYYYCYFCLIHLIYFVPDMASSNTQAQNWLLLSHPVIFEKIMFMIGLDSLESLDICRQVCRSWNTMIMNKIWENPTKKWGTIIQRRIERSWGNKNYYPSDEKISQAKLLAGEHRITILDTD